MEPESNWIWSESVYNFGAGADSIVKNLITQVAIWPVYKFRSNKNICCNSLVWSATVVELSLNP